MSQHTNLFEEVKRVLQSMFPNHTVKDTSIIWSHADSARQRLHGDYDHHNSVPEYSFAAIYSIMEGNIYIERVSDKGLRYEEKIILSPNSVLIFNGDTLHAGAEYEEESFRFHAYLDDRKTGGHRVTNESYVAVERVKRTRK